MSSQNTRLEIRNIPFGSNRFWLCYPDFCFAYAYNVVRDKSGKIIQIVSQSELNFKNEVKKYLEMPEDDPLYYLRDDEIYPNAEPSHSELYVFKDEKLNFKPNEEFKLKKQLTEKAISEIEVNSKMIFVNVNNIQSWLERHHDFYWSLQMDWNVLAFKAFQGLYTNLKFISNDFQHLPVVRQALLEYVPFDEDWLIRYDRIFYCKILFRFDSYEIWNEHPFIVKQISSELYLVGEEFKSLYDFSITYNRELSTVNF